MLCIAEGMPGAFPEGVPQTPGIREEGSPGIRDFQGMSDPLCCLVVADDKLVWLRSLATTPTLTFLIFG
jgi:hypothetical protein